MSRSNYDRGRRDGFAGRAPDSYMAGYRKGKKDGEGCGCLIFIIIMILLLKGC